MNSLTTEPNPFEQSFKIQSNDSIPNSILLDMDPTTNIIKAEDQPHNHQSISNEDTKVEAPIFNSETPRSALFMQYIAQDNAADIPQEPSVKMENTDIVKNTALDSKHKKHSLLPENSGTMIPPSINNNIAANKQGPSLALFKDQLNNMGMPSPWPFAGNVNNGSPGLTTPGGRKVKYDIFNGNLNSNSQPVPNQVNQTKQNQKFKLTPGVFDVDQKQTLSPQDDITKQMINSNSYFPTFPRPMPNERQNTSSSLNQQNGFSLSMIPGERLASNTNNGLNSPGSFFNNMAFNNSNFQNMYFGNVVSPMGNMRTGLTPKIPQPSGLSSNVVTSSQPLDPINNNKTLSVSDMGQLTGPTNINSVGSILQDGLPMENNFASVNSPADKIPLINAKADSPDNVEFAKEIKNEILQKKNNKSVITTGTKKRGRKPGKMKPVTTKPSTIADMDNMTITDIKHHPDLSEDEKKKGILEKNRIAAYNFRQRKKEFIKTLEKKVEFFEKEYKDLSDINTYLLGPVEDQTQGGALHQLQAVLGDNEMAKAITGHIMDKIKSMSYHKRNGENPFSYLDDEDYEPQT